MSVWRRGVHGLIGIQFIVAGLAWSADELPPGVVRGRPSAAVVRDLQAVMVSTAPDKTEGQRLLWDLALSTVADGEDVKSLAGLLADSKWQKQRVLTNLLTKVNDRGLVGAVRQAHDLATVPFQRAVALSMLGRLGDNTDVVRAKSALDATDMLEREAAVECLVGLRAVEMVPELVERVGKLQITPMRVALFGRPAIAEAIKRLQLITTGPVESLPHQAKLEAKAYLMIVSQSHDHGAIGLIGDCLASQNWDVQEAAAQCLSGCAHPEASDLCVRMVSHPNFSVRYYGVRALAQMGTQEARTALLEYLKDPSFSVRGAAAEAVGKLGIREAIPILERMERGDPFVSEVARQALERLR